MSELFQIGCLLKGVAVITNKCTEHRIFNRSDIDGFKNLTNIGWQYFCFVFNINTVLLFNLHSHPCGFEVLYQKKLVGEFLDRRC